PLTWGNCAVISGVLKQPAPQNCGESPQSDPLSPAPVALADLLNATGFGTANMQCGAPFGTPVGGNDSLHPFMTALKTGYDTIGTNFLRNACASQNPGNLACSQDDQTVSYALWEDPDFIRDLGKECNVSNFNTDCRPGQTCASSADPQDVNAD